MRVNSIHSYGVLSSGVSQNSAKHLNVTELAKAHSSAKIINFGGKNMWQIITYTPENNGLGLPETAQGGEGVVGFELTASLRKHEKVEGKPVDIRNVMPYWEHNNPNGGYKFLLHEGIKRADLPDTMPANKFISAMRGEEIEDVAKRLGVKVEDLDYVIQSKPNGNAVDSLSKYCIVEPTSVEGKIKRPSATKLGDVVEIPYRFMKISADNPSYNKVKGEPHYFLYTPDLAASSKPYSYGPSGYVPFEAEIISSDAQRAIADALVNGRMNIEEFGNFNPASVIMHDRPASAFVNHVANLSAAGHKGANGFIIDKYDHNPGRNYQGVTGDPFKFFSVVGTESDVAELKQHPSFDVVERAFERGIDSGSLTDRERQIARAVFDPFVTPFKDGAGAYNITKIPIVGVSKNPLNVRETTVSWQFDKEMSSHETPDAAKFLTGDFASIPRHPNLNGTTPANLRLDDNTAEFGRGNNGLSKHKTEFTTFKYNGNNIEEVIDARDKNARWLTNLIWEASQKGQEELNKLFFNEAQLSEGQKVIGQLSPIKDGEMLIFGFGRPDEQKGFPISTGGYLEYLKREDIPKEDKLRVKLMLGAGKWAEGADDYKAVVRDIEEIQKLDGGIYKNNIMYIDGFTPNRFVACAHDGLFTSRREMCGITPIEAKVAGLPYGSTATGGPVDYTNSKNGYLTREPVEQAPEKYGLTWENSAQEIDAARVKRQTPQVADMIKDMVHDYIYDYDEYVAKCKKNIEEKVDWHENSEYNHGKSANQRLLTDILETDKGWDARNKQPLERLVGKFGEYKANVETLASYTKSKPVKFVLLISAGLAAGIVGFYALVKNNKKHKNANRQIIQEIDVIKENIKNIPEKQLNKVA